MSKYCEKFYEIWRDGKNIGQYADLDSFPTKKGDVLLEYQLNNVRSIAGHITADEEW